MAIAETFVRKFIDHFYHVPDLEFTAVSRVSKCQATLTPRNTDMTEWETKLTQCVRDACTAEVMANKPGNVSPNNCFEDATASDFVKSARVIAPVLARSHHASVGATVLESINATRSAVGHNTNLGIVLLLTPLAAVDPSQTLRAGIDHVLTGLTVKDAILVYRAIQLASPGGLGKAECQDVLSEPTMNLRSCMALAAGRDLIAAQYKNGFQEVLDFGLNLFHETLQWNSRHQWRIAWIAVRFLARFGDSLIQRKCGTNMNQRVTHMASELLSADWPFAENSHCSYEGFDQFLRADGNRRNPGTTADMIAATLFAAFRDGLCANLDSPMQPGLTDT